MKINHSSITVICQYTKVTRIHGWLPEKPSSSSDGRTFYNKIDGII